MSKLSYRADIDGLRAVAVLSVILFHLDLSLFSGGYVGVDMFFVISGYLITRIILSDIKGGTFSFAHFYARRFRRILPAAVVTILVTLLASAVLLSPSFLAELGRSGVYAIFSLSNFFFWKESDYFDTESQYKPLLHTWSLSVEEQFYLFWPLLLLLVTKKFSKKTSFSILAVLAAASLLANYPVLAGALSKLSKWKPLANSQSAIFYLTPFRVFEFALGAFVLWIPTERISNTAKESASVLGWLLVLVSVIWMDDKVPFPTHYALAPCVGAALLIVGGDSLHSSRLLTNLPARKIGVWSYSLYLVHWPLIALYKYHTLQRLDALDRLVLGIATFILALALHHQVEQRFRFARPDQKGRDGFIPRFSLVILGVAALHFSAWYNSGWPWRVGSKAQLIAGIDGSKAFKREYYGGKGCKPPRCESDPQHSDKLVYVIGDSYSRAYFRGLRKIFPEYHFVFFEDGGCEFYTLNYVGSDTKYKQRCRQTREMAFEEIRKGSAPVILTQHFESNADETQLATGGSGLPDINAHGPEEYASYFLSELKQLRIHLGDRQLIVLGGVPKFGQRGSPFDCISRPLQRSVCKNTQRAKLGWHDRFNSVLRKRLPDGVTFVDPYWALCDDADCVNFDGQGMPIYSDYGHLSIWGSEYLVNHLRPQLAPALAAAMLKQ